MINYTPAAVLGCGIGDALGMPFEARGCDIKPELANWKGGFVDGTYHKLPAGTWTDDTEMTVELATAILEKREYNAERAAVNYIKWMKGNPTGMGSSTRSALTELSKWFDQVSNAESRTNLLANCGKVFRSAEEVGSGTAMRAAPIGVFYALKPEMIRRVCLADSYITHMHQEAYAASLAVASLVAGGIRYRGLRACSLQDIVKKDWRDYAIDFMMSQLLVVENTLTTKALKKLISIIDWEPAHAVDMVCGRFGAAWQVASSAILCALHQWGWNYEESVDKAVRLGGDADTRGAITGAILGAILGIEHIPSTLIYDVKQADMLYELDKGLAKGP